MCVLLLQRSRKIIYSTDALPAQTLRHLALGMFLSFRKIHPSVSCKALSSFSSTLCAVLQLCASTFVCINYYRPDKHSAINIHFQAACLCLNMLASLRNIHNRNGLRNCSILHTGAGYRAAAYSWVLSWWSKMMHVSVAWLGSLWTGRWRRPVQALDSQIGIHLHL